MKLALRQKWALRQFLLINSNMPVDEFEEFWKALLRDVFGEVTEK